MAGDENNLLFAVGERLLELETVEAWQLHVENQTRWSVVGSPIEIGLRRGKRFRGQAAERNRRERPRRTDSSSSTMDTRTFGGGFECDEGFAGTLRSVVDNLRIDGQPVKCAFFARKIGP